MKTILGLLLAYVMVGFFIIVIGISLIFYPLRLHEHIN
jgi:hypothetical protein